MQTLQRQVDFNSLGDENAGVELTKIANCKPVKSALKDSINVGDHCTCILCGYSFGHNNHEILNHYRLINPHKVFQTGYQDGKTTLLFLSSSLKLQCLHLLQERSAMQQGVQLFVT